MDNSKTIKVLFIEPFYGGSHKQLIDTLYDSKNSKLISLPAKKWHWRARCGALMLYNKIPNITTEKILFCSSVLNLAELLGIRPDLQPLKKIIYFHENQLVYPQQQIKERDIQYAYNQIISCIAANEIVFNSNFNKTSFLNNIKRVLKLLPDFRPNDLNLEVKSRVLYFPICFPSLNSNYRKKHDVLHIIWPHRWEFDKRPDNFFKVMFRLKENGFKFELSILGESFSKNPPIFEEAKKHLSDEIVQIGYVGTRDKYFEILQSGHVVISTAEHEFFGVAMLEAAYCGCYPLAPNSLVYPEIYPSNCLYSNLDKLYGRLKQFCLNPASVVEEHNSLQIDFDKFNSKLLIREYEKILEING